MEMPALHTEKGPRAEDCGGLQKLEQAGNGFSPGAPRKKPAL